MALSAVTKLDYPIGIGGDGGRGRFAAHFFPAVGARNRVLQVLVHGVSYDHRYWNADTINGEDYSYAAYMTAQGFDILAIDLPGVGASDKPNGHDISLHAVGSAISGMVALLKEHDAIPGFTFDHVSLIGHSMGASISVYSQARWPSADSVVVTATGFYPGRPKSAWAPGAREKLLSDPYPIVQPEARLKFYYRPQADPEVISYDNDLLRCPTPSGLWADCIPLQDDPNAGFAELKCPVLIQLGEHDPILPAKFAEDERSLYSSSSRVSMEPLADIGHSFNLHLNREKSWEGISQFLLGLASHSKAEHSDSAPSDSALEHRA
ncbi:alpha/beta hydrolase [Sinomonas terrae]|uniref:Lysophospholipase n=1 Tax=Sinomonas terrae TaxID=2908838 RepID=A0ABS9U2C6_9MICC|nr:alpha/beta fold hydrolase [Sinomonas terrae]MCH6470745.1 lysophospholipase [Sinomonas terrae]